MNDNERDELLVRVDERVKALHDWTSKHEEDHKAQRASIHKWLGIIVTFILGIISKLIFWN